MGLYIAGDFAAFEILFKRHSGRVYEYLKKKVASEIAQDLMQDTFTKLHQSRAKYNPQYPFLPWLFTISRNTLMDFYKLAETKLVKASSGSERLLQSLEAAQSTSSDVDLPQVLATLPANQRQAIELRYLEDWSFQEIALHMNTTDGNARKLISRGLKFVRGLLRGEKRDS